MPLPRSGPVRSEAARQAILRAAADLLVERGYERLTIEGIAARAGVGKQTIYRWWPSRGEIVAEALFEGLLLPERLTVPDTGDIRADLRAWMLGLSGFLDDERGESLVRSIITAATQNAEISGHLMDSFVATESLSARLTAALGTVPNLPAGVDVGTVSDMILGALLVRVLGHQPLDAPTIDALVDTVLGR
ncbi:TetR/AcrR family transcriptional regulator [Microbacterium sp. NPDC091313]